MQTMIVSEVSPRRCGVLSWVVCGGGGSAATGVNTALGTMLRIDAAYSGVGAARKDRHIAMPLCGRVYSKQRYFVLHFPSDIVWRLVHSCWPSKYKKWSPESKHFRPGRVLGRRLVLHASAADTRGVLRIPQVWKPPEDGSRARATEVKLLRYFR